MLLKPEYLGSVSTEAGPLTLLDVALLAQWTGAGGGSYGELCAWLDSHPGSALASVNVGSGVGVGWDIGGAGTADVYRIGKEEIILYRYWPEADEVRRRDLRLPETGEEAVGWLTVSSGLLLVFWSAANGSEIDLPAGATDGVELQVAGIGGAAIVVELPPGEYRVWATEEADQRWCRLAAR